MDIVALLHDAYAAGLEVRRDGDRLVVRGPRSQAPLAQTLLAHKADVLPLLRESPGLHAQGRSDLLNQLLPMSLAQFSHEGMPLKIGVDWLERSLWFVPTLADVESLVRAGVTRRRIWTASELMDLLNLPNLTADDIKLQTVAKLEFAGRLIAVQPR